MMIKDYTKLLICFTLLTLAAGCSKDNNTANVRTSGSPGSNSGATPLSVPSAMPVPDVSPGTVQVRLTEVETNADMIDSPLSDSKIIIKAGTTTLNKQTNGDGVASFESVPCGNDVVITAPAEEGDEGGVFRRKLECTGSEVDLGVITRAFGGKYFLEQRKPQFMGYDAIKEVWLTADGKIVPNEKIVSIMDKYQ